MHMHTISQQTLTCNGHPVVSFNGGDITTEGGISLFAEFLDAFHFRSILRKCLGAPRVDDALRVHKTDSITQQLIYQKVLGYDCDDHADSLRKDPLLCTLTGKEFLASQPTISRFWNRCSENDLKLFCDLNEKILSRLFRQEAPAILEIDIDTTGIETYGRQEGSDYNGHYQSTGYHPILATMRDSGFILKAELRCGSQYCSKNTDNFLKELLVFLKKELPCTFLRLGADSGFAAPEIYTALETHGVEYAIKLKHNKNLERKISEEAAQMAADPRYDQKLEAFGEFMYRASSWDKERRVVCCIRRGKGTFIVDSQFIVTDMPDTPEEVFSFYRARGNCENHIKEFKEGYARNYSHGKMITNACEMQVDVACYNLITGLKRLCLPQKLKQATITTLRLRLFKIGTKVIRSGRRIHFKMSSSFPYKDDYWESLMGISELRSELAA